MVVYLRDEDHAYKYTYAATSIGSMLYGSIKLDYDIEGYIPKRIEFIFVGVLIFCFTELFFFPRSSRKMVEQESLQFFDCVKNFLDQAVVCTQRMEQYVSESTEASEYTFMLLGESGDPFQLKKLEECHKEAKSRSTKLKAEISSGLMEPSLGLSLDLQMESFRGLTTEEGLCELQCAALYNSLSKLSIFYRQDDDHPVRELNWPTVHTHFLKEARDTMSKVLTWLHAVFPDGRMRAQGGNSVRAVNAASTFRGLEDVRLKIIAEWSETFANFVKHRGFERSDPVSVMTLALTSNAILNLCRSLQRAGKCVEEVAYRFPGAQ